MAYTDTRVKLEDGAKPDYINACYVDSPLGKDSKIIAMQGPLANTIEHVWRMILQENVTLVVSTCSLFENGRAKCEKFWPDNTNPAFKFNHAPPGVSVWKSAEDQQLIEGVVLREFTYKKGSSQKKVRQLHYTGWPDHDVPNKDSVPSFSVTLHEFIKWILASAADEKVVVHCSAGIGRTGTIITLATLLIQLRS